MKVKIASGAVVLLFVIALCAGFMVYSHNLNSVNNSYDLRYKLNGSESYGYAINQTFLTARSTILMDVKMTVVGTDDTTISVRMLSKARPADGNYEISESMYNFTIDSWGNVIKSDVNSAIIPEIRPELPMPIVFPQGGIRKNDTWSRPINKRGSYVDTSGNNSYVVSGIIKYRCLGNNTIETAYGDVDCIGIQSDTQYTVNVTKNSGGVNIYTLMNGTCAGVSWIDPERGVLVRSEYDSRGSLKMDYSEYYRTVNIFNTYTTETPIDEHISCELINDGT